MLIFHKTEQATTILSEGFPEKILIRFSSDPLDADSDSKGDMIVFFDIPTAIFEEYEQMEVEQSYKVSIIPSDLINQYRPAKILTLKSAKMLDTILKRTY